MERHQDSFTSRVLERPVEYLWFGSSGRPLVTFPTASGRYWENEDFLLIDCVKDKIEAGELQVCCIDAYSDDTWNNNTLHPSGRVKLHDAVDRMWSEELFPMVAARAGRDDTIVYGASMGGFHAVNFAARHPEQVSRCIAFSGMFDTRRLLDGHWDDLAYYHCPVCYVPAMDEDWCNRMRTVEWVIATGEEDSIVKETREFSDILRQKNIPVHSEIWPGVFGHDWPFWREHLPQFVP